MRRWLVVVAIAPVAIASIAGSGIAVAQDSAAAARPVPTAPVHGHLASTTGHGAVPLRAADAYLWADTPELRGLLSTACLAARANAPSWMGARTELAEPTGETLDSVAAADLGTLRALAGQPHAVSQIDSTGRFVFDGVPAGDYWIEAESMDGATIAQWWRHVSYAPADLAVARLMAGRTAGDPLAVDLGGDDRVQNEFCADSSAHAATAAKSPMSYRILPSGRHAGVVTPPLPTGPLMLPSFPESLQDRHMLTTITASFTVRADGTVDPKSIAISNGLNSDVVGSLRDAIRAWKFQPAQSNGKNVAQKFQLEIDFSMDPSTPAVVHSPR